MKKNELIDWSDPDAIDLFAPEPATEPPRPAPERKHEPLDVFRAEVFATPTRTSVPYKTRGRFRSAALVALAGTVVVFAVLAVQLSNDGVASPIARIASSPFEGSEPPPVAPPATSATPAPSTSVATPDVPAPEAAVPVDPPVSDPPANRQPPITVQPETPAPTEPRLPVTTPSQDTRAAASTPAPAPPTRLPRPLSQDPSRLAAGVTPPSSSPRATAGDVSAAPSRPPAVSASPPPGAPPAATPSASASTTAASSAAPPSATPPSSPSPSPSPSAVPPPTAAATPSPQPGPTAAVAPTPPPAAAPPAAAAAVIDTNTSAIQNALTRYRRAFSSLDANAAREVWPTVNERTLSRAFERLERQDVSFEGCQINVSNSERAEATCNGTATYVPRVGSRSPRVERRQWHFNLVKVRDEWLIGAVDAR